MYLSVVAVSLCWKGKSWFESVRIEAVIDWTDHFGDDRETLKRFFLASVADCIRWIVLEYALSTALLDKRFVEAGISPMDVVMQGGSIKRRLIHVVNDFAIAVKLSDENFGTAKEIEQCRKLAKQLEEEFAFKTDFLAGGGFYWIQVGCEQPLELFRAVAATLRSKKLPRGSYAEAHYLKGDYWEHDRFSIS
jgi:hypothetical protein